MTITSVRVANLRRFENAEFETESRLNLIFGQNGSGKTSLLEAIHILHAGKSFRSSSSTELIRHGASSLAVHGSLAVYPEDSGLSMKIRVVKTRERTDISVDGSPISSASELARIYPLIVLDANSFGVVDGTPKLRRTLIDRTLFHVEPKFFTTTRRFQKALHQRNQLLKVPRVGAEMTFWENELAVSGQEIDSSRKKCVAELNSLLAMHQGERHNKVELRYHPGWDDAISLDLAYERFRAKEREHGSTLYGPHKGEVTINVSGRKAAKILSRGETKSLIVDIIAAIAHYVTDALKKSPVILADDLPAELDHQACKHAFDTLAETNAQVFVTALDLANFPLDRFSSEIRKFHVEQSAVHDI